MECRDQGWCWGAWQGKARRPSIGLVRIAVRISDAIAGAEMHACAGVGLRHGLSVRGRQGGLGAEGGGRALLDDALVRRVTLARAGLLRLRSMPALPMLLTGRGASPRFRAVWHASRPVRHWPGVSQPIIR